MKSPAAARALGALGLVLALAFAGGVRAAAGEWRASPWVGWEWPALTEVEGELGAISRQTRDELTDKFDSWGETVDLATTSGPVRGGLGYGIEIGRMISARTGLGVRAGAVEVKGESIRVTAKGSLGETYDERWSFDHSLTTVMVGFWQEGGRPDGFSWRGSVFLGPAWADSSYEQAGTQYNLLSEGGYSWDGKGRLTGSTLAFEIGGEASVSVGAGMSLFTEAAYSFASVKEMRWRSDLDVDANGTIDHHQGTIQISHKANQPLVFDFSGLRMRAGIAVRFGGGIAAGERELPGY